jgi:hypothetical protein
MALEQIDLIIFLSDITGSVSQSVSFRNELYS